MSVRGPSIPCPECGGPKYYWSLVCSPCAIANIAQKRRAETRARADDVLHALETGALWRDALALGGWRKAESFYRYARRAGDPDLLEARKTIMRRRARERGIDG